MIHFTVQQTQQFKSTKITFLKKQIRQISGGEFCLLTAFYLELKYQLFPGSPACSADFRFAGLHLNQFLKTNFSISFFKKSGEHLEFILLIISPSPFLPY